MLPPAAWRNRHKGKPGAVLGSGPSLPRHLSLLPAGAVLFAVNARPAKLCRPDYVVFCDEGEAAPCRALGVPRLSTLREFSDLALPADAWDGGFSSSVAAWAACWMGCDPVILCGMDCYRGETAYFDGEANPVQQEYPLSNHLRAWAPAVMRCPDSTRLQAPDGPLADLFGRWQP